MDRSGDIVVAGSRGTVRYRPDGTQLWTQSLPVRALAVDESGQVIVTGERGTAEYSADGAVMWESLVNPGDNRDYFRSVAVDESGRVALTGGFGNRGELLFVTAKLDSLTGELLWDRRFSGSGKGIATTPSGDIVVTGTSNDDILTAKLASEDGASRWEAHHDSLVNRYDSAEALAFDGNGDVIVAGQAGNGSGWEYRIAKHAAKDGALLWKQQTLGDSESWATYRSLNAVAVDGEGNVIAAGTASAFDGPFAYHIAKYSGDTGAQLWEEHYEGLASWGLHLRELALAIDEQNGVIVASSAGTVKYSARGALVWSNPDPGEALALDSEHVYIVGHSTVPDLSAYTAKRSARDGRLVWAVRSGSPGSSEDRMRGILVDSDGNIFVTGRASNSRDPDCYTAKYSGADGSLLWERRYDDGRDRRDSAQAIALDSEGNVVITGYVDGDDDDYLGPGHRYTAKYATKDGALLWERRDENVARGQAVVVNATGDVLVSGRDFNEPGYYTAMYHGSNGRLLGECRLPYHPQGQSLFLSPLSSRSVGLRWDGALALTGSFDGDVVTVLYQKAALTVSDLAVSRGPTGVQIRFTGNPGAVYRLERASALGEPWSLLARLVASSHGVVEYLDESPSAGVGFYRIQQP